MGCGQRNISGPKHPRRAVQREDTEMPNWGGGATPLRSRIAFFQFLTILGSKCNFYFCQMCSSSTINGGDPPDNLFEKNPLFKAKNTIPFLCLQISFISQNKLGKFNALKIIPLKMTTNKK